MRRFLHWISSGFGTSESHSGLVDLIDLVDVADARVPHCCDRYEYEHLMGCPLAKMPRGSGVIVIAGSAFRVCGRLH